MVRNETLEKHSKFTHTLLQRKLKADAIKPQELFYVCTHRLYKTYEYIKFGVFCCELHTFGPFKKNSHRKSCKKYPVSTTPSKITL